MKNHLTKARKRSLIITLVAVAVMLFLLAGNAVLAYYTPQNNIYIDMTAEGLYTLTKAMKKECEFLDELEGERDIEIIFCDDPDRIISSETTRVVYFMALQLQREFSHIDVKCVNASLNPTALAQYKPTSLSTIKASDVIVSYGDRYRIVNAAKFWTTSSSGSYWSYNGEYRMATLLRSVTAVGMPKAYFLTDHGESYYDPENPESAMSESLKSMASLLMECGLEVKTLAISEVEAIPDDCLVLIINNPTEDFTTDPDKYGEFSYISDLEKIDRYLTKKKGALMLAKDFSITLPRLEAFLYDWGIEFGTTLIKDAEASLKDTDDSAIIADYNKDEDSYGYAIYKDYANISSAPRTIFTNAGYVKCSFRESSSVSEAGGIYSSRTYASFLSSSPAAKIYSKNSDGEYLDLAGYAGVYDMAAIVARDTVDSDKNENNYSYIFCANTKDFFSNELLGNASYANYDIVSALTENISRVDEYASTDLGGTSYNSSSFGGKQLYHATLSDKDVEIMSGDASEVIEFNHAITNGVIIPFAVFVFAVPLGLAVLGIVVFVKRKYL